MRNYIKRLKVSDKNTKNTHAAIWAFLFTIIFIIIYFWSFFVSLYKGQIISFQNIRENNTLDGLASNTLAIRNSFTELVNLKNDFNKLIATTTITNKSENVSNKVDSIYDYENKLIQINNTKYNLYIADTQIKRVLGLSNIKSLCENCGLLFIFDTEDRLAFWMKDMLFNIDLIYLDKDYKITDIYENLSPDTFPRTFYSSKLAKYALEINAGQSKILKLKKGIKLDL